MWTRYVQCFKKWVGPWSIVCVIPSLTSNSSWCSFACLKNMASSRHEGNKRILRTIFSLFCASVDWYHATAMAVCPGGLERRTLMKLRLENQDLCVDTCVFIYTVEYRVSHTTRSGYRSPSQHCSHLDFLLFHSFTTLSSHPHKFSRGTHTLLVRVASQDREEE